MNTQNVDPQEIDKFARIADQWWDQEGEFKTLHQINPLRLSFIQEHASLQNADVLDVGCGGGILTEAIARLAARTMGIDMASESLAAAECHARQSGLKIDYRLISVEELAEEHPASFDVVVCMEMLEHVPDPASVVRACARLVKPEGKVFVSTLSRTTKSYLQAIVAAEYLLRWVPRGTHDFKKFIRPSEMARMGRSAGLSTDAISGFTYSVLEKRYQMCTKTDVNYLMSFTRKND